MGKTYDVCKAGDCSLLATFPTEHEAKSFCSASTAKGPRCFIEMPDGSTEFYELGRLTRVVEPDGYVCLLGIDFD